MKGLLTPSPGGDGSGSGGLNSSSSSLLQHRFIEVSQRSSRQRSPSDGHRPHQNFAVLVPAKPRYVPKPDSRPQVASTPYQTINAPFRPSRKILSKETLPGGSIIYHLGAFLPSTIAVVNAVPDIIQVSATNIDDHVSYDELERFEHEDFELELAREHDEIQKLERRQTQALLRGSFKRGRGRPKKHQGLLSPLGLRRGRLLGQTGFDISGDSGETESETATTDLEDKAIFNRRRAVASKKTEGRHGVQVRVEIPIRPNEKERTSSKSIFEANKPMVQTSIVPNRLEPLASSKQRSSKGNATSSIVGSSRSSSGSSRDGGKVAFRPKEGFLNHETKNQKYNPVVSLTSQRRPSIEPFTPATTGAISLGNAREERSQTKAAYPYHQTPTDQPRIAPVNATNLLLPKNFDPILIDDEESDNEDGEDFVRSPQVPPLQRSKHHKTGLGHEKVIPALTGPPSVKKDISGLAGDVDSHDELDVLVSRPAPTASDSNHLVTRPFVQHITLRRNQSPKISNSPAASPLSNVGPSDQPLVPPALPLSSLSKYTKSSPTFVPDTDSEDDLVAAEQLLREFEGEKTRVTETANSMLQRFQKQPSEHLHPPSSPIKSLVCNESITPSTKHRNFTLHSSPHRKPSMTTPFPSGKPVRRSNHTDVKEKPQTGVTRAVIPLGDSDNDSSTKKRKRDKQLGRWRTPRPSDDPEAEWNPNR